MSTKITKELAQNLVESKSVQNAVIKPGGYATFHGKEGRNYVLAATNMDSSYDAIVQVYDMDWGNLVDELTIPTFQADSVIVKMGKGNGIRVYNLSNEQSPGRPEINASLYSA